MIYEKGKKYFTLSEANTYVPLLQRAFGRIQQHRIEIREIYRKLSDEGFSDLAALLSLEGNLTPEIERLRGRVRELVDLVNAEVSQLQKVGCVVKDLDAGLVDFYSRREGQDVFLCWQQGEDEIRYWHGIEEGFMGRKLIEGCVRHHNSLN